MSKPIQIKEAHKIATDCIRHVLKEANSDLKFKWIRATQEDQLRVKIDKLHQAIAILEEGKDGK